MLLNDDPKCAFLLELLVLSYEIMLEGRSLLLVLAYVYGHAVNLKTLQI